jgi:heme ABC exporter ATP-binding subunit CcmA
VTDDDHVVVAERLRKQFGPVTALANVSLRLSAGQCLAVFGRNGAGKTTLLKIIATLIRSYGGSLGVFGSDAKQASQTIRRQIGFVSHEAMLYPDLTVRDNLVFYARLYRLRDIAERVDAMIEATDLVAKASAPVRTLSRGLKQRAAIARAFLHEPRLMLLDEPFTGLDDRASKTLDERLREFQATGGSSIIVTHNAERAWQHANRLAVLDKGIVAWETTTTETALGGFVERYRSLIAR